MNGTFTALKALNVPFTALHGAHAAKDAFSALDPLKASFITSPEGPSRVAGGAADVPNDAFGTRDVPNASFGTFRTPDRRHICLIPQRAPKDS